MAALKLSRDGDDLIAGGMLLYHSLLFTPISGMYNLYALNPSFLGEPCPTQPKQVKTIPTIAVGKEGLVAFTVWINVNGFPPKKMNIYTNEGPVGGMRPRDLRPATNTQDPREVHDHDRDITGKDTNPFSEGRETHGGWQAGDEKSLEILSHFSEEPPRPGIEPSLWTYFLTCVTTRKTGLIAHVST